MMNAPALRIRLALPGRRVEVAHPAPTGPARLDELLPFMYAVDDAAIAVAVGQARKSGANVSCAKGCSACCKRQPVPVTPAEAHGLARRVQALPQPRRARVEQRFADAVAQLRAAGLFDTFMRDTPIDGPAQARDAATAYMALGLVCPFLEDDACSIHAQRPFVCRQYLVSSPPALCADPLQQPVAVLDIPVRPAGAMLALTPPLGGKPAFTVPLVLALAYAARHADTPPRSDDARQTLAQWLDGLLPS
ncbi:YkgJ family cysteine cluster protein [Roseateles sp. LYH14W]|uniref:YkgJ family cysteine cluster protein n=1 Tax=Pelomonas parva TaxID=3299032 RepID=A0ABW7F590_9BURK